MTTTHCTTCGISGPHLIGCPEEEAEEMAPEPVPLDDFQTAYGIISDAYYGIETRAPVRVRMERFLEHFKAVAATGNHSIP